MEVIQLRGTSHGFSGGVGSTVHMIGALEHPTLVALVTGEAAVGPDQTVVRAGQAVLAEPGEVVELRPLTEPVETLVIEFWPSFPFPRSWSGSKSDDVSD